MSKDLGKMTSNIPSNLNHPVTVTSNHSYSLLSAISTLLLPSCLSPSSLLKASLIFCFPGGNVAVRKGLMQDYCGNDGKRTMESAIPRKILQRSKAVNIKVCIPQQ